MKSPWTFGPNKDLRYLVLLVFSWVAVLIIGCVLGALTGGHRELSKPLDLAERILPEQRSAAAANRIEILNNFDLSEGGGQGAASKDEVLSRMRRLSREPNNLRRSQLLVSLVETLTLKDLPDAAATARLLSDYDRTELLALIAARWSELDPKAGAAFALTEARYLNGERVMESALSVWVTYNPEEAISFVRGLSEDRRDGAMESLITVLARRDPEVALRLLQEQSEGTRSKLSHHVATHWAQRDPKGLAEHTAGLPTGQDGDRLARAAMAAWAQEEPLEAIAWAKEIADPNRRGVAISSAYRTWALGDPEAAYRDALTLPAGDPRDQAVASVASARSGTDAEAAMQMMEDIQNPKVRDGIEGNRDRLHGYR
jgi:hypothetical protein